MARFIEEFYYGNIDPQARSTKQNKTVQKEMAVLTKTEEHSPTPCRTSKRNGFSTFQMRGASSTENPISIASLWVSAWEQTSPTMLLSQPKHRLRSAQGIVKEDYI